MPLSEKPIVSIIVPCYNYGHFLAETLESLKNQTLENWECIVVDDGSTDNTREIAQNFTSKDSRYTYLYQQNAGLSAARNAGILSSKGDYIQLLDADDFIADGKLKEQVELFKKYGSISIVYGEIRYFKTSHPKDLFYTLNGGTEAWMKPFQSHEIFTENLMQNNLFAVNCALIKRAIIRECGYFNTNLKSVEDWEFWVRCALSGYKFLFNDNLNSFAFVRVHGYSMSQNAKFMCESSILARKLLQPVLHSTKLSNKENLKKINRTQLNFLHRKMYDYSFGLGVTIRLNHLFKGYSLLKNWKFIMLEFIHLFNIRLINKFGKHE
jgi:glycosyltransferase involved in cell wall biosynthesis